MNRYRMLSLGLFSLGLVTLGLACRSEQTSEESSAVKQDFAVNSNPLEQCNRPQVRVDPPAITAEGTATFSWNLPGYRSVRNDQGLFSEERGPTGSILIRGGTTRMLRLIATPLVGNGPEAIFELPLRVEAVGGEPRVYSFYSTKPVVAVNETTQLRWIVGGCSSLEIRGPGGWTHGVPCRGFEDSIGVAIPETGMYALTIRDSLNNPIATSVYRLEVR